MQDFMNYQYLAKYKRFPILVKFNDHFGSKYYLANNFDEFGRIFFEVLQFRRQYDIKHGVSFYSETEKEFQGQLVNVRGNVLIPVMPSPIEERIDRILKLNETDPARAGEMAYKFIAANPCDGYRADYELCWLSNFESLRF